MTIGSNVEDQVMAMVSIADKRVRAMNETTAEADFESAPTPRLWSKDMPNMKVGAVVNVGSAQEETLTEEYFSKRYSFSRKLQRLAYGPFIEDFLEDLREDRTRFSVYMGHDFGPANSVMDPLQLTWMDSGNECASILPPFGATLTMESYTDKKVRFIYNGRVASVEAIKECRGRPFCSHKAIVEYLKHFVPSKRECRGTTIKYR
ncbi:hypothetical protein FOZ63_000937 [Perkinsus olseni]|uniref:Uncharacterized protein n=1 Tax=Perkinsus olseni TaxID=32597 RepID=A0A7J6T8X8_PEROL|nr:hypothetical protein FOZ63_000937 [Perkinsus olseni]